MANTTVSLSFPFPPLPGKISSYGCLIWRLTTFKMSPRELTLSELSHFNPQNNSMKYTKIDDPVSKLRHVYHLAHGHPAAKWRTGQPRLLPSLAAHAGLPLEPMPQKTWGPLHSWVLRWGGHCPQKLAVVALEHPACETLLWVCLVVRVPTPAGLLGLIPGGAAQELA